VEFYLPKGKWTNFFTNKVVEGPGWFTEHHKFDTLPLYVRENTILTLGKQGERRTVYDYTESVEVRLYHIKPGTKADLVDSDGLVVGTLEVGPDGNLKDQNFLTGSWHVTKNNQNEG
jgi:alpha-D-xyloside xylohydrolase